MQKVRNYLRMLALVLFLAPSPMAIQVVRAEGTTSSTSIFSEFKRVAKEFKETIKVVMGVVLALGLLVVVYMVATSNPRSRDFVIGWVIAAVLVSVGWMVIG